MAWREQMQKASFRGVPFVVQASDGSLGRRNVIHEYPQRDVPYAEDLGRKAQSFSLEALIIGADYMAGRDSLVTALEKPGAGELVHPYRGRVQVVVTSARLSESTAEGGLARFSIEFTESGEAINPAPGNDTGAQVFSTADNAISAVENAFTGLFDVAGFQDFVSLEALATVIDAIDSVREVTNSLLSNSLLPEFTGQLAGFAYSAGSLLRFPETLAAGMMSRISSISSITDSPSAALTALQGLFNFGDDAGTVPATTPSRQQQALNQAATIDLVRTTAIIEAARVSTQITPASYPDAIALRDNLAGQLESQAETAPDAVYTALLDLRIAVIKDITTRAADLSRTVQYPVPVTQPMLVIVYRLYGDIDQAESLLARNKIRHPGFVYGGRTIEVLTA